MIKSAGLVGLLCGLLLAAMGAQAIEVPNLTGPVMDHAEVLAPRTRQDLAQILRRLMEQTGTQLVVWTIPTVGTETIEQVGIQAVSKWKLGDAREDRGVLFLISRDDRQVRIEVGQGLEGDLPDATASRIIYDRVIPYFRQTDYDSGVLAGVMGIVKATNPDFNLQSEDLGVRKARKPSGIPVLFFLAIILFSFLGGGGRRRGLGGGGWGGPTGGWGGGSGGGFGGGFGGGGGGFSGGGASGRW